MCVPAPAESDEKESDEEESDEEESDEDRSRRVLCTMAVIHQYKSPMLWLKVAHYLVDDGYLKITNNELTTENFADLIFVLQHCDVSQVTCLE